MTFYRFWKSLCTIGLKFQYAIFRGYPCHVKVARSYLFYLFWEERRQRTWWAVRTEPAYHSCHSQCKKRHFCTMYMPYQTKIIEILCYITASSVFLRVTHNHVWSCWDMYIHLCMYGIFSYSIKTWFSVKSFDVWCNTNTRIFSSNQTYHVAY